MKKWWIILLLTVMVFSIFSIPAFAEDAAEPEVTPAKWFEFSDGVITKYKGGGGDVVIPSEINGEPVTSIGNRAFYRQPSGFDYPSVDRIRSITIPNTVTSIGAGVFDGCTGLKNINVGSGLANIDGLTFDVSYGNNFEAVNISEDNPNYTSVDGVVYNKDRSNLIFCPNGKKGDFNVPGGVTEIVEFAFADCDFLTSVTMPDSVINMGEYAFANCDKITDIALSDNLTSIRRNSFMNCYSLTEINIPGSVKSIGISAFYHCYELTNIIMEDGVESIGETAFLECRSLKNMEIPASLTSIAKRAFSGCHNIEAFNVAEGNANYFSQDGILYDKPVTRIIKVPGSPLKNDITIHNGITSIDRSAFNSCIYNSIAIPDGVTSIGQSAFECCYNLTGVVIPDTVTSIDFYAFDCCSRLKDVYYTSDQESWDNIKINPYNEALQNATIHFNSRGVPQVFDQSFSVAEVRTFGDAAFTKKADLVSGTGDVRYSSSDERVAVVDAESGEVTIVGSGTATITATAASAGIFKETTAEYTLTVEKAKRKPSSSGGKPTESAKPLPPSNPEQSDNPFTDVNESDYYHDAVLWAVKSEVTTGTSDTTFSPDMSCTRSQAVTFMWRAAGSPEPAANINPFKDVSANAYYYKAVQWAVENGIVKGTSATTFSPDDTIARGQMAACLWRLAGEPDVGTAVSFADVSKTNYYYQAVAWAAEQNITKGTSNTEFSPNADCTRGQIVTFLYKNSNLQ